MIITATAANSTETYQPGDTVAVIRTTQVSPATGTHTDWHIADPATATDGPLAPTWGDPAGHTVQRHGWGTGRVVAVAEIDGQPLYTVDV
jgi:hypothetical protein